MAYNTVYTFVAYDTLTAAQLNNNDANLDYLKSKADRRIAVVSVVPSSLSLGAGDGKKYISIPNDLDGANLVEANAVVYTVSSSGTPTIQIHNVTDSVDMLSTAITIDANEFSSYTAATPSVVNTSNDDVASGDRLRIDVDVAGTGTAGLDVHLDFLVA